MDWLTRSSVPGVEVWWVISDMKDSCLPANPGGTSSREQCKSTSVPLIFSS